MANIKMMIMGMKITTWHKHNVLLLAHQGKDNVCRFIIEYPIYENFWAGGVKQPLNPSRHPSMDEASSEAGRTVAMDSS
jgi:hypothetical protein